MYRWILAAIIFPSHVGLDAETNVSPDYRANNNSFTGKIVRVTAEQR